ncbi:MAG TPA: adenylate kinase [Candidatus Paceibacterota bacterium]|nr:adenylate kinase [Verrucomicrobiota bacterium]HOX03698.1 adenylate kinase [Verrucomicrobiota bacterium]HRZ46594.1 adenylate kinase [Candidatus Paceibacterota bacterium]HRZ91635.1 adenylate kinase [Candidatus Paceibacterota bacterium]
MNIAFIGPTCAGKTTTAERLRERFGVRHLSTGQVLRENRSQETVLGILTRKHVERGQLVPDEIVNAMIEEAVRKLPAAEGLLLDGFPSTLYQARFLEELLRAAGRRLDAVLFLDAPEPVVLARAARRTPPRPDDRPEIIHHRLQVFRRTTGPVIAHFHGQRQLVYVDAAGSIGSVSAAMAQVLEDVRDVRPLPALTEAQEGRVAELIEVPWPERPGPRPPSLDIVLMGAPGSGKGTQAALLATHLGIPHIATGELFRENRDDKTILGRIADGYVQRGELVPDDVVEAMVRERLGRADAADGYVLEGFPRTLSQAQALEEIMASLGRRLDQVFFLRVSDPVIVQRLSGRRLCSVCQTPYHVSFHPPRAEGRCDRDGASLYQRDDDDPATIQARLESFRAQTLPVIDFYRQRDLLVEVPGDESVEQVSQGLAAAARAIDRR